MSERFLPIPSNCQTALAAIEADPFELSQPVRDHLCQCAACTEVRVQWLAQEDIPVVLTPAGYFDRLPDRILRKLPTVRRSAFRLHPVFWLAAGILAAALGVGGYLVGRVNRVPLVEANQPPSELHEMLPDAPFRDSDDAVSQLSDLSPEDADQVMNRMSASQSSNP